MQYPVPQVQKETSIRLLGEAIVKIIEDGVTMKEANCTVWQGGHPFFRLDHFLPRNVKA